MPSSQSLSGKWLGSYSYEYEEEEIAEQQKLPAAVTFSLELTDNNGSITGTCIDDEVKDLMKGIITVTGFVDGDVISFTKQYPCFYSIDENGLIQVDESKTHPPVIYSGVYDADSNTFSGDWEMTIATENLNGECYDDVLYGTWIISKSVE